MNSKRGLMFVKHFASQQMHYYIKSCKELSEHCYKRDTEQSTLLNPKILSQDTPTVMMRDMTDDINDKTVIIYTTFKTPNTIKIQGQ